MAAIDKIYGTREQYHELVSWMAQNMDKKEFNYCVRYIYPVPMEDGVRPIANFPKYVDIWLLKKCPFAWVTDQIKEQYKNKVIWL